ncbi:hypothetical protein AURDEDRAFT_177252 [Auricularia subglabra TFB-10046 SS5]|uniref:Uncharacterized protein n=1 Tax=Auricularia subglabra (strain TFB-10046 / SS5) TaxID=717982 RepID=J0D4I9_AURST|nr:hypothetical protein AURDEDRAFT_177252 [Auricularia subglabra TFB-10046 SS5]
MPPSRTAGRRRLRDTDATVFSPSLPPEAFGWCRPGPAVLRVPGFAVLARQAAPVEISTSIPTSEPPALADRPGVQTPTVSPRPSTGRAVESSSSTRTIPSTTHVKDRGWIAPEGLPLPRESTVFMVNMRADPKCHYYLKRTCGKAIDCPDEPAGPIADRTCINPPAVTVSNTIGNLRVNVVGVDHVQIWFLGGSPMHPVWVPAEAKVSHPDKETFPEMGLSLSKPYEPKWIKQASLAVQGTRGRSFGATSASSPAVSASLGASPVAVHGAGTRGRSYVARRDARVFADGLCGIGDIFDCCPGRWHVAICVFPAVAHIRS